MKYSDTCGAPVAWPACARELAKIEVKKRASSKRRRKRSSAPINEGYGGERKHLALWPEVGDISLQIGRALRAL